MDIEEILVKAIISQIAQKNIHRSPSILLFNSKIRKMFQEKKTTRKWEKIVIIYQIK